jgi:hypothetical protein
MESRWIWPFELLDKIGEGGMGVVYRARYVGNDRQVAVKLIPNDVTANATVLARFERELDVLKKLSHPNIVHCFGGRCESKQRFYAMEYVPGGTLADLLQEKGELPWETAVDFAIQMCEALQCAHERGITHRDVKPGNFLITKSGQLKLSDFGLASIASESRLTASGRTVGTILYMSPEQVRGEPVTPKVDLYGLGCVIFEMLVGTPPYSGRSAAEVLQQHLKAPIPHVARLLSRCPLELDELVFDLLAKDAEQRPASAADVASRLKGILLPGQRPATVEPVLFPVVAAKRAPTIPMKVQQRLSEAYAKIGLKPTKSAAWIPWTVVAVMACCSLWMFYGWAQATSELKRAEQNWVDLLQKPEPEVQVLAARSLAKFESLHPATIEKLRDKAKSRIVDVQLASLHTLKTHAAESRSINAELVRIQKVDENTNVRNEAGHVLTAIRQARRPLSVVSLLFPLFLLIVAAGIGISSYWIWKRVKPIIG